MTLDYDKIIARASELYGEQLPSRQVRSLPRAIVEAVNEQDDEDARPTVITKPKE
jgi:hypothetical protein